MTVNVSHVVRLLQRRSIKVVCKGLLLSAHSSLIPAVTFDIYQRRGLLDILGDIETAVSMKLTVLSMQVIVLWSLPTQDHQWSSVTVPRLRLFH